MMQRGNGYWADVWSNDLMYKPEFNVANFSNSTGCYESRQLTAYASRQHCSFCSPGVEMCFNSKTAAEH